MANKVLSVRIPETLLLEMEKLGYKKNRSAFILEAVEERVRRERLLATVDQIGKLVPLQETSHWETPEKIDEWLARNREIEKAGSREKWNYTSSTPLS